MTDRETVWITGATSGIGLEITRQLAATGKRVIATGRNEEALSRLHSEHGVETMAADIALDGAAQQLMEGLQQHTDHLDRVILNAGTCEYFNVKQPDWDLVRRVMAVNFDGTLNCLEASLPLLLRHRIPRGHLVAVGSQASRAAFPRAQAYGASKAAVSYFMECMAVDLASEGIDVTVVQPGFVDTPLTRRNDFSMPFLMSAERAAALILRKLEDRPLHLNFPWRLSALLALGELAPRFWCRNVATRLSRSDAADNETNREA